MAKAAILVSTSASVVWGELRAVVISTILDPFSNLKISAKIVAPIPFKAQAFPAGVVLAFVACEVSTVFKAANLVTFSGSVVSGNSRAWNKGLRAFKRSILSLTSWELVPSAMAACSAGSPAVQP